MPDRAGYADDIHNPGDLLLVVPLDDIQELSNYSVGDRRELLWTLAMMDERSQDTSDEGEGGFRSIAGKVKSDEGGDETGRRCVQSLRDRLQHASITDRVIMCATYLASGHEDPCAGIAESIPRAFGQDADAVFSQRDLQPAKSSTPDFRSCTLHLRMALRQDLVECSPSLFQKLRIHRRYKDVFEEGRKGR